MSGDAINIFAPSNFFNPNLNQSNASINNLNGEIANTATLDVTFDDGGSTFGIGSAESSPLRVPLDLAFAARSHTASLLTASSQGP